MVKGSLNFLRKKKEAERIDYENLKMAKRIVNSDASVLSHVKANREHANVAMSSKKMFQVDELVQKQRRRMSETFGHFSR